MNTSLQSDLSYVRTLAEAGARAPSLGGRFGVLWGGLSLLALSAHWSALVGIGPIAAHQIGLIWLVFALVGSLASGMLGVSLRHKPGQTSPGNRVESVLWPVSSVLIFGVALAIAAAVLIKGVNAYAYQNYQLFDFILPLVFSLYALNYATAAILFETRVPRWAVGFSVLAALATVLLIGNPAVYLVAGAAVAPVVLLPGITALRAEPMDTV